MNRLDVSPRTFRLLVGWTNQDPEPRTFWLVKWTVRASRSIWKVPSLFPAESLLILPSPTGNRPQEFMNASQIEHRSIWVVFRRFPVCSQLDPCETFFLPLSLQSLHQPCFLIQVTGKEGKLRALTALQPMWSGTREKRRKSSGKMKQCYQQRWPNDFHPKHH